MPRILFEGKVIPGPFPGQAALFEAADFRNNGPENVTTHEPRCIHVQISKAEMVMIYWQIYEIIWMCRSSASYRSSRIEQRIRSRRDRREK